MKKFKTFVSYFWEVLVLSCLDVFLMHLTVLNINLKVVPRKMPPVSFSRTDFPLSDFFVRTCMRSKILTMFYLQKTVRVAAMAVIPLNFALCTQATH